MTRIRDDLARRGGRSVVLSHCFAAGVTPAAESSDVERDITAGGLDVVPLGVFDGCDYVALGHIHGRATLTERVRYSGAPLHYSFAETDKPRGAWLVEIGAEGLESVEWVGLPVPRRLTVLTGQLAELLADEAFVGTEGDWVKAILTDQVRPLDAMRSLQTRFTHAVALEHRPAIRVDPGDISYAERIGAATSDPEIIAGFLAFVRNGVGPTVFESELVAELLTEQSTRMANS